MLTKPFLLTVILTSSIISSFAQETEGNYIKDNKTGCLVWFKHSFSENSVEWSGGCKDGYAHGKGTMIGYTNGTQTSKYIGELRNGKPNGIGTFTFWGDRKLSGNFRDGEPLFLPPHLLSQLERTVVSDLDSLEMYVGDNNQKKLYYDAIVPKGSLNGVVVLIPGTWTTTEYLFSSLSEFCKLANNHKLAVIALSINQRLTLTDETMTLMNTMIGSAIAKYKLPKDKFILGGWSMGGIFSLRYAEFANQDPNKTVVKPAAVFSCDGPCDLKNIYNNFKRKFHKNPGQNEPAYGMRELEKYCGGTPETAKDMYSYFSPYSHLEEGGGNAKYLLTTPVRIYADVDPVWWMKNRKVDAYDLNALDQTAMIQLLNDMGNSKAEFINSFQKGTRIEGNRHPHSWSIIEPKECIQWILGIVK